MSLKTKIISEIKTSMKKREKEKLEALRYLLAQIQDKELEKGRKELTDEEVIKLINGQIKKIGRKFVIF